MTPVDSPLTARVTARLTDEVCGDAFEDGDDAAESAVSPEFRLPRRGAAMRHAILAAIAPELQAAEREIQRLGDNWVNAHESATEALLEIAEQSKRADAAERRLREAEAEAQRLTQANQAELCKLIDERTALVKQLVEIDCGYRDGEDALHGIFTHHGIASRMQRDLVGDVIRWAATMMRHSEQPTHKDLRAALVAEAQKHMPDGLAVEEVMRIVKRCEPALTNEDSEHRCGVRGFAESGDDCLGCKRDAIIVADKRRRS